MIIRDSPLVLESGNVLLAPFVEHARRAPQAPAVRAGNFDVSYGSLLAMSARRAAALGDLGIASGDVVALVTDREPETLALMLAIVASGGAYLPLDPSLADSRLQTMIDDARPAFLIDTHSRLGNLSSAGRIVDRVALESTQGILRARRSGPIAYVLFTSGSTGRPKGVAMRTRAVASLIEWHRAHPRLGAPARTLQFAPLGFDVSFQEIFSTLATGGTLILPTDAQRRDPWALLDLIERERIARIFVPCVALQALAVAATDRHGHWPATLRDVITAGEQLRVTPALRALFSAQADCVLHNHYGPTETHVVSAHELSGSAAAWPELPPIGLPLPHVRARIAAAQGDRQETGTGELLLGGGCLAAGYIGQPGLTAERFFELDGETWYRTGDRVRRNAAGELEYLGRLDEQLKIAGQRVEPAEVEALLCRDARVAEAVVVAQPTPSGPHLVAHVVPRNPAAPSAALEEALRRSCTASLPDHLRPRSFVMHAALPMTSSGKIDRRALLRSDAAIPAQWDDSEPLSSRIASLWKNLLGGGDLDSGANLFDQGARSLDVVHALAELRRHGYRMSVTDVYENPTVAAQVALLERAPAGPRADAPERRALRQRTALAAFARPGQPA